MLKKIKNHIRLICVIAVIAMLSAGAVVLAESASKNDDMKYSVKVINDDGDVREDIPVGIGIRGDADCDEKVTVRDAALIARYLVNYAKDKNYMPNFKNSLGGAMADANNDGQLTIRDAAAIAKYLSNKAANSAYDWE